MYMREGLIKGCDVRKAERKPRVGHSLHRAAISSQRVRGAAFGFEGRSVPEAGVLVGLHVGQKVE